MQQSSSYVGRHFSLRVKFRCFYDFPKDPTCLGGLIALGKLIY